eukprot:XP_027327494.1 radical S-adenosyl methionine domain-containing protein 1, mitochondrial [Anas platyrhynchos]
MEKTQHLTPSTPFLLLWEHSGEQLWDCGAGWGRHQPQSSLLGCCRHPAPCSPLPAPHRPGPQRGCILAPHLGAPSPQLWVHLGVLPPCPPHPAQELSPPKRGRRLRMEAAGALTANRSPQHTGVTPNPASSRGETPNWAQNRGNEAPRANSHRHRAKRGSLLPPSTPPFFRGWPGGGPGAVPLPHGAAGLAPGRGRARCGAAPGGDPGGASAPGTGPGPEPGAPGGAVTAALYVHWPYCRKHCSYCSFNKYVVPAVDEAAVRACLVREARTLLRLGQVQSVTSVFFGGGTPSLASPHTIAAVLEAAAEAAHLPAGAEVTLEANPSSASPAHLANFKAAGVNRLSVGVQSLDAAELRLLGREHTVDEARAAVEAARGLFPGRTSIDLLFGLPGQSQEAWARSLEAALGLCDDHLALYQLTLERGTVLEAQVRRGALPAPPQDLLADMYHTARAVLAAAGFCQYEVSNFARKGALSTHNLSYWRAEQYVGVGPGAHGRFVPWGEGSHQREARVQTPDPDAWMREVQSRGLEELLALGLRTDEGITQQRWGHFSPQLPLRAVFGGPGEAMALQQQGWLLLDGRGLRCTPQGLAVLDSLLPALLCQLQRTAGTGGRGTEGRGGQGQEAAGGQGPEAHGGQGTEAVGEQGTAPHGGHGTEAGREQGP